MNTTVFVFQIRRMVESKIAHYKKRRFHSQQLCSKSKHPRNRRVSSPSLQILTKFFTLVVYPLWVGKEVVLTI